MIKPKILVIGDVMIDRYIIGNVERQSPEADVPVVSNVKECCKVGGAGNVAMGLVKLGAEVHLSGVVDDFLYQNLENIILTKSLYGEVTVKTRLMNGNSHIARIDNDVINNYDFTKDLTDLNQYDLIILSDYAKGVVTKEVAQLVIKSGVRVIVDPKGNDYSKYNGAFLIKPNKQELEQAGGWDNVSKYCKYVLATLANDGMDLRGSGYSYVLPSYANDIVDVTGAGDSVLSALAYFIAKGANIIEACKYASISAAISIQHIGNYNPILNEILEWKA